MLSKLQPVKFFNCLIGKFHAKMQLILVLVVPLVWQISGLIIGIAGYLSLPKGQQSVKKQVIQLGNEICDAIAQYLNSYLSSFQQTNEDAIELGLVDSTVIVVVVIEAEFIKQINHNHRMIILFRVVTLLVATGISILISGRMIKAIVQLNILTKKIALWEWQQITVIQPCVKLVKLACCSDKCGSWV
ncbi:MAG: hypothetical protein EA343_19965 [Nodularia sp. (in: Bacteria)]|nr:MAG: hypothetical protein EA343_19965 [Nodularia sp. (in: cyanobacteria)]